MICRVSPNIHKTTILRFTFAKLKFSGAFTVKVGTVVVLVVVVEEEVEVAFPYFGFVEFINQFSGKSALWRAIRNQTIHKGGFFEIVRGLTSGLIS